jgi:hypothetical protein
VRSALDPAGRPQKVTVVAEGVVARNYAEALKRETVEAVIVSPQACFAAGMLRLVPDWLR